MSTPPTPNYAHLGELLTLMREEMRKGFDDLRREVGGRVSADVYESDKRLTEERIGRLGSEIADLRADMEQAKTGREQDRRDSDRDRAADRRMIWGAVIAGVLSLVVGAVLLALQLLTN
ncbi:hypothetical protein KIK06_23340 [Nocardiopsis sp. EMB25]|uniref:hypothetical protein n=1 Tax=Nocardiopsis sp. EMB25 TaxID=2835867 RepID=UPI00228529BE|nr:hypothetical protein [Nocardiopsis sp. EMB25]MCY9786821.1 hypothetical protein [Nocardiopsis sp. EMB25]